MICNKNHAPIKFCYFWTNFLEFPQRFWIKKRGETKKFLHRAALKVYTNSDMKIWCSVSNNFQETCLRNLQKLSEGTSAWKTFERNSLRKFQRNFWKSRRNTSIERLHETRCNKHRHRCFNVSMLPTYLLDDPSIQFNTPRIAPGFKIPLQSVCERFWAFGNDLRDAFGLFSYLHFSVVLVPAAARLQVVAASLLQATVFDGNGVVDQEGLVRLLVAKRHRLPVTPGVRGRNSLGRRARNSLSAATPAPAASWNKLRWLTIYAHFYSRVFLVLVNV